MPKSPVANSKNEHMKRLRWKCRAVSWSHLKSHIATLSSHSTGGGCQKKKKSIGSKEMGQRLYLLIWEWHRCRRGFLSGSVIKNPLAIQEPQEMQVRALGLEDSLVKGTATHSTILAWGIPWTEEPGRLPSMGSQRVGHDWSDLAQHSTRLYEVIRVETPWVELVPL